MVKKGAISTINRNPYEYVFVLVSINARAKTQEN